MSLREKAAMCQKAGKRKSIFRISPKSSRWNKGPPTLAFSSEGLILDLTFRNYNRMYYIVLSSIICRNIFSKTNKKWCTSDHFISVNVLCLFSDTITTLHHKLFSLFFKKIYLFIMYTVFCLYVCLKTRRGYQISL